MQFDELLAHPTFWEQIWFDEKERDRDLPEPVKLHQSHLISGTVALADITEQTRVYHYILVCRILFKDSFLSVRNFLHFSQTLCNSALRYNCVICDIGEKRFSVPTKHNL